MKSLKVAIIGGGSITWMPTFLKDLAATPAMESGLIVLHDILEQDAETMRDMGRKIFAERNADIKIDTERDLDAAISNADFVVNTVLVGGHSLWAEEMKTIVRYGVPHPKGMSVGPGGLSMGLRQIPFVLSLAKKMEILCPSAWLLNFSNPMQSITLAVMQNSKIKYLGLCHGVTETIDKFANLLNINASDLFYTVGGINHFEVIKEMRLGNRDLLPEIADACEKRNQESQSIGESVTTENYRLFGAFQCNADIHGIEFWPHYIHKDSRLESYQLEQNSIDKRIADRNIRWGKVKAYNSGKLTLSETFAGPSTEKLDIIINGVKMNAPTYLHINVINNGAITNIDDDICVEIPAVIFRDGLIRCIIGDMPHGFREMSIIHGAVQRYSVQAALTGDKKAALHALTMDPICYTLTLEERETMLDELLRVCKDYLPAFS